jgi:hypothetical protein
MAEKKHIITHKIKKGSLIKWPLENIKAESFDVINKELKQILGKHPGIYAFYYNKKLVKVGMASELHRRMNSQWKDKKLKWNNFSIFVIRNIKFLRDLETTIVRIAKPKGNKIEGRVPQENYLKRILSKKIKDKQSAKARKVKYKNNEISALEKEIKLIKEVTN